MKNVFFVGLLLGTILLQSCKPDDSDDSESAPCALRAETIPVLIENPEFAEKEYGYTALGIEKGDYSRFVVTTSSTSPYYPNFESTTTTYDIVQDLNGTIIADGEFNGGDYWFVDANFEATNASIQYAVHLECDIAESEEKVVSQTSEITISSPTLCELMGTYTFWEAVYDGIPASQSSFKVRLGMKEDPGNLPLQKFISEGGVTLRATTEFDGVTDPSKVLTFPDITNVNTEMSLNLFELTGYDQSAWPDSHNAKKSIVNIKLEIKVCNTWYPIGMVIWQTLG